MFSLAQNTQNAVHNIVRFIEIDDFQGWLDLGGAPLAGADQSYRTGLDQSGRTGF